MEFFIVFQILFAIVCNTIDCFASTVALLYGIITSMFEILMITNNGTCIEAAVVSKFQVKPIVSFRIQYNNAEHLQNIFFFLHGINIESTKLIANQNIIQKWEKFKMIIMRIFWFELNILAIILAYTFDVTKYAIMYTS